MNLEEQCRQVLALAKSRLVNHPVDYDMIAAKQDLLIAKELVTEVGISGTTKQELEQYGFSPGVAAALKKAFPDPTGWFQGTANAYNVFNHFVHLADTACI